MATSSLAGLLIGGEWVPGGAGTFEVHNPANGEVVGDAADATAADVAAAVDAADAALPAWQARTGAERATLLRRVAESMRRDTERIAEVMTDEQGKPLAESRAEVAYAASFFDWFAGEAERIYGMVLSPAMADQRMLVLRQPVGVTAAITPWNFPAAMLTRKVAPALAAGCTTVVKPASATPLTALEVARVIVEAEIPAGVVNVITSTRTRELSDALFGDGRVRKISFTGSTEVGKELIRASAGQVKRLSLELGGHAPFVVFDDADLDAAVDNAIRCKFRNSGQTCVCANRIYVQRTVHTAFVDALARRAAELVVGPGREPGVEIGPLIDRHAVEKSDAHVEDAVGKGAQLLTGGRPLTDGTLAAGSFYAPTVLDGVTQDMLVHQEETFGPVAGVTVFDTEQEVVTMANDSVYGLAAYLFTRDYARLLRVAEGLEYGIVGVNTGIISAASAPFGGMKESGFGREGGPTGIDEYLDLKYVAIAGVNS